MNSRMRKKFHRKAVNRTQKMRFDRGRWMRGTWAVMNMRRTTVLTMYSQRPGT
jgi:hypothetical protein